MPIYRLNKELAFPHPELADEEGILAIGGDLTKERLLLAYCNGIFPWFNEGDPILWWSPDPRFVLYPKDLIISKSMGKILRKHMFRITFDTCFREVISYCSSLRTEGTWITSDIKEAYCSLHELGYAHSVEAWYEGKLVGGLYGVSLGACFYGESMFSTMANASKAAFLVLTQNLVKKNFILIDCQVHTNHLESLGAIHLPRKDFLSILQSALEYNTIRGSWTNLFADILI
jgi:leucyl/phenylalanyl-tRNA--protein transferase